MMNDRRCVRQVNQVPAKQTGGQAGDLSYRVRLKRWDNFAICILIFSFFIEVGVYKGFPTVKVVEQDAPPVIASLRHCEKEFS